MDLLPRGLSVAFRGARRGNPALTGLGAALAAFGLLRRMRRPRRELIWARTLRPGEAFRIRVSGSDDEVEIRG